MGEFGATITFVSNIPGETQTLPSLIYTLTQIPGGDAGAMRLTLVSIVLSMVALLGSELWRGASASGKWRHEPGGRCRPRARDLPSRRAFFGGPRADRPVRPVGPRARPPWSISSAG